MILDGIVLIGLVSGFAYGYNKGLVHSIVSVLAIVLAVLLAMNLWSTAAAWLSTQITLPAALYPTIAFLLVLLAVLLAMRLVSTVLTKLLTVAFLGLANRMAGGVLWAGIACLLLSTAVWFASKAGLFQAGLINSSYTYTYLMDLAPAVIDSTGAVIPLAKDAFHQLSEIIEETAKQVPAPNP